MVITTKLRWEVRWYEGVEDACKLEFEFEMVARLARQGDFVRTTNIEVVMVQVQMKVHWIFVMACVDFSTAGFT